MEVQSLLQYEKAGRLQQMMGRYLMALRAHALLCEAHLEDIVTQRIPPFQMAARWLVLLMTSSRAKEVWLRRPGRVASRFVNGRFSNMLVLEI